MNKELSEYERGVIDGRQIQMQSSVDKAVNAMSQSQRTWVGLTDEEIFSCENSVPDEAVTDRDWCIHFAQAIEAKLKEKNSA